MASIRFSKQQRNALLTLHHIELRFGLHTPVNTRYLREEVSCALPDKTLHKNHFLVGLLTLAERGYVVYQPNTDRLLNANALESESMWQLTQKGRQYAEQEHQKCMTPKRHYTKRKKRTRAT